MDPDHPIAAEECEARCKVCGCHTHAILEHRIRDWHLVLELNCEKCQEWAVRVFGERLLPLLNEETPNLQALLFAPGGYSQAPPKIGR